MKVKMSSQEYGNRTWTIQKRKELGGKSVWTFTTHDNYERHGGLTWAELVAKFREVAGNYGFVTNLS